MLSLLIWKSSTKSVSYSGILRDKTMDDKLIYTLNYDKQEYPLCKLKPLFWKYLKFWANELDNVVFKILVPELDL